MIIRSLRSIARGYRRADSVIFEEPESPVVFETQGAGVVSVEDSAVKTIVLSASLHPVEFRSGATLEHISTFSSESWKMPLDAAKIDYQSEVQAHSCCSAIVVKFENTGAVVMDGEKKLFTGKSFDDYELLFDDALYVKKFQLPRDITEKILQNGIQIPEGVAARKIYPYGGFFEYGVHPRRMESCVFYVPEHLRPVIKVVAASRVKDLTRTILMSNGKYFVGTQVAPSLYEDIMNGECKIILKHKKNERNFVSNALFYYENTNLVKINFVQQ